MFGAPPPGSFDPKAFIAQWKIGNREEEKVYGPVYAARMIQYALQYLAKRTGEKPPEDIRTFAQLADHALSKIGECQTAYCALTYAQCKTEKELQGQIGAAKRINNISWQRQTLKPKNGEERNIDLSGIVSNFRQAAIAMKLCPAELGYRANEDGSLDVLLPNCFYKDACRELFKEDLLTGPGGKMICNLGIPISVYLRATTGYEWDYQCLEYDKPNCTIRQRMV